MPHRSLFATFIGINAYPQSPLYGCIQDVLQMDHLLQELCTQQGNLAYKPFYLLAPHDSDKGTDLFKKKSESGNFYEVPTFEAVSQKAFAHLKEAKDGDICLLYYSGHGSQVLAPEVFWHTKPDRNNETLVCVDSRDPKAASRDLIDKEVAYLLWDALEGKEVHCLVVMDCCHSGNNTRAALEDEGLRYRHRPPAGMQVPLEEYIGYNDPRKFYTIENGKASIRIARYVHMAAARDDEKALETGGGLFTNKLLEALRSGGTAKSYRSLVQSLSITVRSRNATQNPVAYAREKSDLDLKFLGSDIIAYQPSFEVRYDWGKEQWIMHGGAMDGLIASNRGAQTLVWINGLENDVPVTEVFGDYAVLDNSAMESFDKASEQLQAVVKRMANAAITVGLSKAIWENDSLLQALKAAYTNKPPLFFKINSDSAFTPADYIIRLTAKDDFVLTQAGSDVPLFKREKDMASFLANIDSVGKWFSASQLSNADTRFTADDFVFTLEKIEGQQISAQTIEKIKGIETKIAPNDEVVFAYRNSHQPAFRLRIEINESSSLQFCYVGVLYLESKYGIKTDLVEPDAGKLVKGGSPLYLQWENGGRTYKTLPLNIDKEYALYGINEITSFLKIIVSAKPVSLQRFAQENLKLDDALNVTLRNIEFAKEADNVGEETAWTVFTKKFRISGPKKEITLDSGSLARFAGFDIKVPQGFSARAFAATGDDVRAALSGMHMRSLEGDVSKKLAGVTPPPSIWGDVLTDDVFAKGISGAADNGVAVLELMPDREGDILSIPEGSELLLQPTAQKVATRSVDNNLEETVVPFGYDEETELYIPLGFSDEEGNVHIQHLPPPTVGRLESGLPLNRSLGGSVKLFFKKLLRKKKLNTLVLWGVNEEGNWQKLSSEPEEMKGFLQTKKETQALLLIHGIIGDTLFMCEAAKAIKALAGKTPFLLTYDYENLARPVNETAIELKADLKKAGFAAEGAPALTILAHSMGGLVARWLIEQEGGSAFVARLIMAGTPNGGSEMAKLILSVEGLLAHALNVTGPIKYAITGLSFLVKKLGLNPLQTLDGLKPGSEIIQKLAADQSGRREVPYTLICGNTSLLKSGYDGDDLFLKKLAAVLMGKLVYPALTRFVYDKEPNDLAVRIKSMKALALKESDEVHHVPCDHLTYFGRKEVEAELV